jgi:hypothetical protein
MSSFATVNVARQNIRLGGERLCHIHLERESLSIKIAAHNGSNAPTAAFIFFLSLRKIFARRVIVKVSNIGALMLAILRRSLMLKFPCESHYRFRPKPKVIIVFDAQSNIVLISQFDL